jgi:ABC-type transport system involved in Fe-S cluster assembly fused permease/ATPase subunit
VEPLKKISLTENQMLQKRKLLAAKQANAFNFIEGFPEKFETIVGERD